MAERTVEETAERVAVLAFIRGEAARTRFIASDYRVKRCVEETRVWNKIAEAFGNIANRIQHGEHRESR